MALNIHVIDAQSLDDHLDRVQKDVTGIQPSESHFRFSVIYGSLQSVNYDAAGPFNAATTTATSTARLRKHPLKVARRTPLIRIIRFKFHSSQPH
jgi:hypothetical protein